MVWGYSSKKSIKLVRTTEGVSTVCLVPVITCNFIQKCPKLEYPFNYLTVKYLNLNYFINVEILILTFDQRWQCSPQLCSITCLDSRGFFSRAVGCFGVGRKPTDLRAKSRKISGRVFLCQTSLKTELFQLNINTVLPIRAVGWKHLPYLFDEPPWALIKFLDLQSGRLFEAGRLLNFHHFQLVQNVYFATKQ